MNDELGPLPHSNHSEIESLEMANILGKRQNLMNHIGAVLFVTFLIFLLFNFRKYATSQTEKEENAQTINVTNLI